MIGWRSRRVVIAAATLAFVATAVVTVVSASAFTALLCSATGTIPFAAAPTWCSPAIGLDDVVDETAAQVTYPAAHAGDTSLSIWPSDVSLAPNQVVDLQVRLTHPARTFSGVRFGFAFDPRHVDIVGVDASDDPLMSTTHGNGWIINHARGTVSARDLAFADPNRPFGIADQVVATVHVRGRAEGDSALQITSPAILALRGFTTQIAIAASTTLATVRVDQQAACGADLAEVPEMFVPVPTGNGLLLPTVLRFATGQVEVPVGEEARLPSCSSVANGCGMSHSASHWTDPTNSPAQRRFSESKWTPASTRLRPPLARTSTSNRGGFRRISSASPKARST